MKPIKLRFSLGWAAALVLVQAAAAVLCVALLRLPPRVGHGRYASLEELNQLSNGWLFIFVFGALAAFLIFRSAICGWRFFARTPAIIFDGKALLLHPSYVSQPCAIPVSALSYLFFGRGDREEYWDSYGLVSSFTPSSGRWGAKCRSVLFVEYVIEGRRGKLRIMDNVIEGGTWRLGRLAVPLRRAMAAARA